MNPMEKGLCEWVELYAIGGLSDEAAALFNRHLLDCASCQRELRELREVTELLPLAAEPVPMPAGMKRRVLDRVLGSGTERPVSAPETAAASKPTASTRFGGVISPPPARPITEIDAVDESGNAPRSKRRSRRPAWKQAALAAAMLALVVAVGTLSRDNVQLNRQLADKQSEVDRLLAAAPSAGKPMLAAHSEQAVSLSPAAANIISRGLATIVVDSTGTHLIVQAEKLPELQGTEAFQVWLLKDGKPSNAGTFTTSNGNGALTFTLADNRSYDTLAITLEPDAYGNMPRGQMILKAPLINKG